MASTLFVVMIMLSLSSNDFDINNQRTTSMGAADGIVVNVGDGTPAYTRYTKIETSISCHQVCKEKDPELHRCLQYEQYCPGPPHLSAVNLYLSKLDRQNNKIFGPYVYHGVRDVCVKKQARGRGVPPRCLKWSRVPFDDTGWYGCGIRAAQNALRYFGLERSQNEIDQHITTHRLPGGQIATYPGALRNGLQDFLDLYGKRKFRVVRHEHKDGRDVIPYLNAGMPVIALVDGGTHWVVVSGYDETGGYFIQDNWAVREPRPRDLDLGFDAMRTFWANIDMTDYESGTFITFEML